MNPQHQIKLVGDGDCTSQFGKLFVGQVFTILVETVRDCPFIYMKINDQSAIVMVSGRIVDFGINTEVFMVPDGTKYIFTVNNGGKSNVSLS